jgi:hypothetical protein
MSGYSPGHFSEGYLLRDLTPFIIQALTPTETDGALLMEDLHLAFEVTLRDEANTVLRWSTGILTADSINNQGYSQAWGPYSYSPEVRGVPNVAFTLSKAPDGGTLQIQNLDNVIGTLAGSLEDLFNKARVVMYVCFKKPSGNYEVDPVFVGLIDGVGGEDTCEFDLVSDFSDKGALVAARYLTQHCIAAYKGFQCRYSGPEPTCSFIKEDAVNGCRAKGWEFAFFGANFDIAKALELQAAQATLGTGRPTGFDYGNPSESYFPIDNPHRPLMPNSGDLP